MANSYEQRIRIANEELLAKGNLDVVDETFAAGYVVHAGGKDHHGLDFVRRFVKQLRAAIADLRVVEIAILSEAGDVIVWQRTLSGTHQATLGGIPPSAQKVQWRDMAVSRFDGDKIAEEWTVSELAGELLLHCGTPNLM